MACVGLLAATRGISRPVFRISLALSALITCMADGGHAQSAGVQSGVGQTAGTQSSAGAAGGAPQTNQAGTATGTPAPAAPSGGPGLPLSGLSFTSGATLTETYSTNGRGLAKGGGGSGYSGADWITRLALNFGAHDHTPRFSGDLDYTLAADKYARRPSYDRLSNYLTALARAMLVPDRLQVQGRAFTRPVLINDLGPLGADNRPIGGGANSGIRNTYGYTVSSDLLFRLGAFARSDTILTQSSIFFENPRGPTANQTIPDIGSAPRETFIYSATEQIANGTDFSRLFWNIAGTATKASHNQLDFNQAYVTGDFRYAITRAIAVTTVVGYRSFTSNQSFTRSIDGVTALGGVQLTPMNNLRLSVSGGTQFGNTSYVGNVFYQLGPYTTLTGAVTDSVALPGQRFIDNLGALGVNGAGSFYDTGYQLNPATPPPAVSDVSGFDPVPTDGAPLTTNVSRYRAARLSVVHIAERTQYRLTGYRTTYESLTRLTSGVAPSGTATGVALVISRNMSPRLSGSANFTYSMREYLQNDYKIFQTYLNLSYSMTPVMDTYFRVAYLHRNTDRQLALASPLSGDLSDFVVSIGIHRQFF